MQHIKRIQRIFQLLGDINRLKIISAIGVEERSVSDIIEAVGLSQPLVSHHLRALRENGILNSFRKGPFIYYQLANPRLLEALTLFSEIYSVEEGDDRKTGSDESESFCFQWMKERCRKK